MKLKNLLNVITAATAITQMHVYMLSIVFCFFSLDHVMK